MERQDFRNYKSVHQLQYSCTALITLETAAENHAIGGGNLSKLDFYPLSLIPLRFRNNWKLPPKVALSLSLSLSQLPISAPMVVFSTAVHNQPHRNHQNQRQPNLMIMIPRDRSTTRGSLMTIWRRDATSRLDGEARSLRIVRERERERERAYVRWEKKYLKTKWKNYIGSFLMKSHCNMF